MESKNIKRYIYLGTALLLFLISYFLLYPLILEVRNTKKEIAISEQTLQERKEILGDLKAITEKYKKKEKDFQKIDGMLFPEPDLISLLIQFDNLASKNGMIMDNISFGNLEASDKKVGIFPVNLEISGSYNSFKNYLEALAKNLNLIDVETISIQMKSQEKEMKPGEKEMKTQEEGESDGMYSFSLKVNTYTQKMPKTAEEEISTETEGAPKEEASKKEAPEEKSKEE